VTPPATPLPAPAAPAVPQPPSRFHVQIGAFDERQNADALVLRMRSLGYAASLTDGPPYRVWVGGYLDRATAERLIQHLKSVGIDATLSPR